MTRLLAVPLAVLVIMAAGCVTGSRLSDSQLQHSYQVGHDEVGPVALGLINQHPEVITPDENGACFKAIAGWAVAWDDGEYNHVEHSAMPDWWDVKTVTRGCLDYVHLDLWHVH